FVELESNPDGSRNRRTKVVQANGKREARRLLSKFEQDIMENSHLSIDNPFMPAFIDRWRTNYARSEEHTSELQSRFDLVCRLLLMTPPPSTLFPYTTLFRSFVELESNPDGSRNRRTKVVQANGKREARRLLSKFEQDIMENSHLSIDNPFMPAFIDRWRTNYA